MTAARDGAPLDAVVIGAGFAGLAAATALARQNRTVLLLEARERVGGRVKPGRIAGMTVDLGGMWLGPTQTHLKALTEAYQMRTYRTPIDGKSLLKLHGKASSGPGEDIAGALNVMEKLDYARASGRLDALAAGVDAGAPWESPGARRLDAMTGAAWINANARTRKVRTLLRLLTGSLFCAEPEHMSMLFMALYIKAGGGLKVMLSAADGGGQNFLFHGGVHQAAVRMGEELGRSLRLDEPVRAVEAHDGGARVITGRDAYDARRVIVATPPPLARRMEFNPLLPRAKSALLARMTMGSVIKAWIAYETPFWRARGLNGLILSDDAPFSPVFDATPDGADIGLLSGFFDSESAIDWADATPDERRALVLDTLAEFLGDDARRPLAYEENDWTGEAWSLGCYGAFAPPGVLTRYGHALRTPTGPIHWAGTETATEWIGYIDGALQSGHRAAREVMEG